MNNNNQFPREMSSGFGGNTDAGSLHHVSDAHKHQENTGGMSGSHPEGMMKSNSDHRYELGQQNTTNMYGSSYLGAGQSDNSHGYNQNQSSSQPNYGMDRGMISNEGMGSQSHPMQSNMMNYSNMSQNQPSIGQRNFQSFPQTGYGFPHMSNEMPSDLGGMIPGSMQHSYMQSNKPSLPTMQNVGMSSAPLGYHGEKTYEPGSTSQLMPKHFESHSDIPLPIDVLREYEEKCAKSKQYNQTEVFAAILLKNEDDSLKVIEHLIKKGVSLTATDALDQTALFYAARDGKSRVVSLLLDGGCNPNHKDQYGQTAIYYAARENKIEIAEKLIDAGADLNVEDMHQQTCLFYAAKSGNIDMWAKLIDWGVNINHMDNKRQTALHWANKSRKMETVDYLISRGASPINRKTDRKRGNMRKKIPNERKEPKKYVLTTFIDGQWLPLSEEDLLRLEKECPQVADIIKNPTLLENLDIPEVPEEAPIYDHWEKPAKRIINNLWKQEGAWLFHFPVDVKAWKIEDYYTIIKDPMDFTTIKGKLSNNDYKSVDEFVVDVNKVFNNWILYNGEANQYSQTAKKVRKEFENQYNSLWMDFYKSK